MSLWLVVAAATAFAPGIAVRPRSEFVRRPSHPLAGKRDQAETTVEVLLSGAGTAVASTVAKVLDFLTDEALLQRRRDQLAAAETEETKRIAQGKLDAELARQREAEIARQEEELLRSQVEAAEALRITKARLEAEAAAQAQKVAAEAASAAAARATAQAIQQALREKRREQIAQRVRVASRTTRALLHPAKGGRVALVVLALLVPSTFPALSVPAPVAAISVWLRSVVLLPFALIWLGVASALKTLAGLPLLFTAAL